MHAGAEVRAIVATDDGIGPWLASQYPDARASDPYDDDITIVVTAAIPGDRAAIVVEAARAGKSIVSDKPGVTTRAQLDEVRASGARWLVVFGERLGSPAMHEALRLVEAGAIGEVVHTVGLGPHRLNLRLLGSVSSTTALRPGILVDIRVAPVDQFHLRSRATGATVLASTVPRHGIPGLQVLGEILLAALRTARRDTRVDYFTPKGFGSWGDLRFTVVKGLSSRSIPRRSPDALASARPPRHRAAEQCHGRGQLASDFASLSSPSTTSACARRTRRQAAHAVACQRRESVTGSGRRADLPALDSPGAGGGRLRGGGVIRSTRTRRRPATRLVDEPGSSSGRAA